MIFCKLFLLSIMFAFSSSFVAAQNSNSSTTPKTRPRSANTNTSPTPQTQTTTTQKNSGQTGGTVAEKKVVVSPADAVLASFNKIMDGVRRASVTGVTSGYLNSPSLVLFNYNGTITKGWDQMRKNRESSYPDIKDVKLDVKDVHVVMLGTGGAVVTCSWNQSQTYKGTPETVSGRMTLVFKRVGTEWKAVHLHTSPDKPDPSRVPASEQTPAATPTPVKP